MLVGKFCENWKIAHLRVVCLSWHLSYLQKSVRVFFKDKTERGNRKSSVSPLLVGNGSTCWLMGGDAVISAAMPLQPSPVWHPTLSHPLWHPASRFDHRSSPSNSVSSPLWALCGRHLLPNLFGKSFSSESQEKKKMYCYINLSEEGLWRNRDKVGSLIVKCRDYALYECQRCNVQKTC